MSAQWHDNDQRPGLAASNRSNNPGYAAPRRFSRIADMFKDSMSAKRAGASSASHDPHDSHQQDVSQPPAPHNRRASTSQRIQAAWTSMTTSTPKHEPCSITHLPVELLQHIFLHLDFFTLLRIRSVSKVWNELIPGDSPLLQETLFLKPSNRLEAYGYTLSTFNLAFDVSPTGGLRMTRRCKGLLSTEGEIEFCPVVPDFDRFLQRIDVTDHSKDDERIRKGDMPSWRNMLLSMPPLQEVCITRSTHIKCTLRAEGGVRLGDVVDALQEWERGGEARRARWKGEVSDDYACISEDGRVELVHF